MIEIRPLQSQDIEPLIRYWLDAEPAFLQRMGVDLKKLPQAADFQKMLSHQLSLPIEQRNAYALIWLYKGQAVGHCNTNPTVFGDHAYMHLHLWRSALRGKGLGLQFVRLCLPHFFEKLQLQTLYSQPYALNPAPHKTLAKAGFTFDKAYVTVPGSINFEQPVKRWVMYREQLKS